MTTARLEVRVSRVSAVALGCAAVLFGGLGVGIIAVNTGGDRSLMPLALGLAMFALLGVVAALVRRARRRSVRSFTDAGLLRRDGVSLPWSDLSHVVHQVRTVSSRPDAKQLWRTEIHFRSGESAWLVPNQIANLGEVLAFVRQLPCEQKEDVVGVVR